MLTRPRRSKARPRIKRAQAAGSLPAPPPEWFVFHPWLREAGIAITSDVAIQVSAVYGCCRLIVDCLAPAPITVTEIQPNGIRQILHDDAVGYTLNYGAMVADAPDAPPAQAVEEALLWSALTGDGNGYAEIQRDGRGGFFGLWPIESERVTPRRDERGNLYYEIRQPMGGLDRLPPIDMFHVRGPSLRGWVGDSLVYRASKAIGIAQAAQVYSAAYFANGTVISGLLTSDKIITQKQADEAKAQWIERHGGGARAHGVSILGQGLKYQPINSDAKDSQLVESRRFQVQEIARYFGVPTTLLADNEAWTNLGDLYLGFYNNALRPWAERFDAEATRKLFPQRKPWRVVEHDLTHLTLGSFKDRVAALTQATGRPIWTRNEARAVMGKNSVTGGDEFPEAPARQPSQPQDDGEPPIRMPMRRQSDPVLNALDGHARRVSARLSDLSNKGNGKRDQERHVRDLRSLARRELNEMLGPMDVKELDAALEAVEHGVDSAKAAHRLLDRMPANA